MKHIALLALIMVVGCKNIAIPDIKPPVINIPPVVIGGGQPDKPVIDIS